MLRVHEVAKAATLTFALVVLAAAGLPEVGNRGIFSADDPPTIKLAVEFAHAEGSLVFCPEFDIHIANHVVADVVRYNKVLDLTVLGQLHEHLLVEILEMLNSRDSVFLGYITPIS